MATAAEAINRAANPKPVDESLWWDSSVHLFNELEEAHFSSEIPSSLVNKLKKNHSWFLGSVSLFKLPNEQSKSDLEYPQIAIGSQNLKVRPELKEVALQVSSCLCLDEVQSYILVNRSLEHKHLVEDCRVQEFLHLVLLQYYLERQCLLKCIRQILIHASYTGKGSDESDAICKEALQLVNDGFEGKLLSVLQNLFASKHPEQMDVDLTTLWAEETLIEVNLVLDILFLAYYDTFCTCKSGQWKSLCSLFKEILSNSVSIGKLAISTEARNSLYHAKVQLLLILVETLDLDNLLQMVHDEVPFRKGHSVFSMVDLQEMDAIVSSFNALETTEAGPLILAWATFLCLISSLPEKQDNNILMEIDHLGYVRQAFETDPLSYVLEILHSDELRDSDGPVAGYRSVLRTFIAAFIACYEINHQMEDGTFNQILDILCKIYHGEETLCIQFWDRDSFVDGPIRCLLYSLESEFPFRTVDLVRLLSALCEGTWPAECVYNFLNKMAGITSLFEITGDSFGENNSHIVQTVYPLHVPGVEGLIIPSRTRGHVLRIVEGSIALVRWEYTQSGILVLLLRLARELHLNIHEDVFATLDLLSRIVSFNTASCFAFLGIDNSLPVQAARMNGHIEKTMCVDVVKIICTLVSNLAPSFGTAGVISMCISILSKLVKCSPSHVVAVARRTNIFGIGTNDSSSSTWLLSGGLARLLLVDCEEIGDCCSLIISVLDFTLQLVEAGAEDSMVSSLVVFCLQYVLVNHEHWKYRLKHSRWKVTLKVLEVVKSCIKLAQNMQNLGSLIRDILLCDSSIHSTLFRIMCITSQTLERVYFSRLYESKEIEGLQCAVSSALDVLFLILTNFSKDFTSGLPVLHQAVLSSTIRPVPVATAAISLVSFFSNPEIQVSAARLLSMLCFVSEKVQSYLFGNVCLVSDDLQITDLRLSICNVLCAEVTTCEDLFVAVVQLLTSAACYQPALFISIMAVEENAEIPGKNADKVKVAPLFGPLKSKNASILDSLLQYVKRSAELIESHPYLLLNVLDFLKTLWQGASQYMEILETLKSSGKFWRNLTSSVTSIASKKALSLENQSGDETLQMAYRYQCQSAVLDIVARELFFQKKILIGGMHEENTSEPSERKTESTVNIKKSKSTNMSDLKDILSTWFESSVLDKLVKLCAPCGYDKDVIHHTKMATSLCIAHIMHKLSIGDAGSLTLSFVEKLHKISTKLNEQPSFSELVAQYASHGYSGGKRLNALILNDLYYHLQGELDGREITPGPFKDLSQYLYKLDALYVNESKQKMEFCPSDYTTYLFDPMYLRASLGLEYWDHSDWKASKAVAERMLLCMNNANLMAFLADAKGSTLKALIAILTVYEGTLTETTPASHVGGIDEPFMKSCIDYLCKCLQITIDSLVPAPYPSEDILNSFATPAQILLNLVRFLYRRLLVKTSRQHHFPLCMLVIKTSGTGLRVLCDIQPSTAGLKETVKLFLTLLLISIEFSYSKSHVEESDQMGAVDAFAEVSVVILGLLPILCKCIQTEEYCDLSLAAIDVTVKAFVTPSTWFPVLQKHLQLQLVIWKLQQTDSLCSVQTILRFLLTLARNKGGAQMLQIANFFSSLKMLFARVMAEKPFSNSQGENSLYVISNKEEKPQQIWGLGVAIITATIKSLGEDSSSVDLVESCISYFFLEKASLISYYLSAPDFPTDDHNKKRARVQKTQTSLTSLIETEHTLMLICILAEYHQSWCKAMKEMDSEMRERSIHLLAFISKGAQHIREPRKTVPLLCPPVLKEEMESYERPPFINSKNGWFVLCSVACVAKTTAPDVSTTALSDLIKDRRKENSDLVHCTYFSDSAAIQIYRIAFLLLKFLCLQAKAAAARAEEVGFINLAHFPELPMPEILHGLQDQAIAIVTELSESNKPELVRPDIQDVCLLLLQILEKALYLELCVSQICGIRPVSGRVEDFSRGAKALLRATEGHAFFKASLKSLRQIIALVYPGLLQIEVIM